LSGFCEKCIKSLTYVNYSDICPYCFSKKGEFTFHNCIKNTHISRNISTFEFSKDIQEFIHEVKYSYRKKLLKNFLKRKITAINLYGETPDLILPVPLHKHKMLQRGFNQSQIIAEHTARILSIPCSLDILYREKDTAAQSTLDEDKRSENVKNAFAVYSNKKELIKGKCRVC
jgi:ComF family protein